MNASTKLTSDAIERQQTPDLVARWISKDSNSVKRFRAWVACFAILGLSACNKTSTELPQAGVIQPTTPIVTVPAADTVLTAPAAAPNASSPAGRANSSLTRAEEASAMPLPGQNNDHSAPVMPASAPK